MKKAKRFAAMAAALMMAGAMMSVTAWADEPATATNKGTITINNSATAKETHKYEAYQIFAGTIVDNDGTTELNVTGWGTGIDSTKTTDLITKIKEIGDDFKDVTDAASVANVLAKDTALDSTNAQKFAKVVAGYLSTTKTSLTAGTKSEEISAGYYLIQDEAKSLKEKNDAYTRFILKVVGDATATSKSSIPTVVKKVKENEKTVTGTAEGFGDAKYNDVADYNVGDDVAFALKGTMPSNIEDYTSYFYQFNDTIDSHFDTAKDFVITIDGKKVLDETAADKKYDDSVKGNLRVKVSGTQITVSFEDIKALKDVDGNAVSITANSVVLVEYKATLKSGAVLGLSGQENKVDLSFSNNPNVEYKPNTAPNNGDDTTTNEDKPDNHENNSGDEDEKDKPSDDDTGKTPEDKVIVFTYGLETKKVASNGTTGLKGAKFIVKADDGAHKDQYVKSVDNDNYVTAWTDTKDDAKQFEVDESTSTFNVYGLDAGKYTLTEVAAPTDGGYTLPSNPDFPIEIVAETVNNQTWDGTASTALTKLQLKVGEDSTDQDVNSGIVKNTVINNKGASLPETGGIGTTIFYAVGGSLVVASGVLLITKKRAKKD